jgi:antitoxin (DNA-binding transcriptional repressor) of toxin-antitoxin stability system
MQTLTVTAARAQLGHWLGRALRGEEIGVVVGAQVVALRPVPIQAADYLEREYGLTTEEADRAVASIWRESDRARAAGEYLTLEELSRPHASSGHRRKKGRRQPRQVARH